MDYTSMGYGLAAVTSIAILGMLVGLILGMLGKLK